MDPSNTDGSSHPSSGVPQASAAGGLPQVQVTGVPTVGIPLSNINHWRAEIHKAMSGHLAEIKSLQNQIAQGYQTATTWQNQANFYEALSLSQHSKITELKTKLSLARNKAQNVSLVEEGTKEFYGKAKRLECRLDELQKQHSEHHAETRKIREDVNINAHRLEHRTNETKDFLGMMFSKQSACLQSALAGALAGVGAVNDGGEGSPFPNTGESQEDVNVEEGEIGNEWENSHVPLDQVNSPLKLILKKEIAGTWECTPNEAQGLEIASLPFLTKLEESKQSLGVEGKEHLEGGSLNLPNL